MNQDEIGVFAQIGEVIEHRFGRSLWRRGEKPKSSAILIENRGRVGDWSGKLRRFAWSISGRQRWFTTLAGQRGKREYCKEDK